jgi:hypothetical protein
MLLAIGFQVPFAGFEQRIVGMDFRRFEVFHHFVPPIIQAEVLPLLPLTSRLCPFCG